jgi:hypothetical protein
MLKRCTHTLKRLPRHNTLLGPNRETGAGRWIGGGAALALYSALYDCLVDLLHRGALAVVTGAVVGSGRRAVRAVRAVRARLGGRLVGLLQDGEGDLLELLAPRVNLILVSVRLGLGLGLGPRAPCAARRPRPVVRSGARSVPSGARCVAEGRGDAASSSSPPVAQEHAHVCFEGLRARWASQGARGHASTIRVGQVRYRLTRPC